MLSVTSRLMLAEIFRLKGDDENDKEGRNMFFFLHNLAITLHIISNTHADLAKVQSCANYVMGHGAKGVSRINFDRVELACIPSSFCPHFLKPSTYERGEEVEVP